MWFLRFFHTFLKLFGMCQKSLSGKKPPTFTRLPRTSALISQERWPHLLPVPAVGKIGQFGKYGTFCQKIVIFDQLSTSYPSFDHAFRFSRRKSMGIHPFLLNRVKIDKELIFFLNFFFSTYRKVLRIVKCFMSHKKFKPSSEVWTLYFML